MINVHLNFKFVFLNSIICFCISCQNQANKGFLNLNDYEKVELKYAENFELYEKDDIYVLKNKTVSQKLILLYPSNSVYNNKFENVLPIAYPVKNIACASTIDVAFLNLLEKSNLIKGMVNPEYVFDPSFRKQLHEGKILNLGKIESIDIEQLIAIKPAVFFLNSVSDAMLKSKLENLELPIFYVSEHLEKHPLGRLEWALSYAAFTGDIHKTLNKINIIKSKYQSISKRKKMFKPKVFTGAIYNGIWYMAGGKSLTGQFIKDAGGFYAFEDEQSSAGIAMDQEVILKKCSDAEIWINPSNYRSLDDMIKDNNIYNSFEAFSNEKLYNHTKRCDDFFRMDYFESGITHPHLILNDLYTIFQGLKDSLHYYEALQ